MLFEETAPAGTETTFHLHRDSDEVAWVLSGEITFKIGDEITVADPAPVPSCHAACRMRGRMRAPRPPRPLPLYPGHGGWVLRGAAGAPGGLD